MAKNNKNIQINKPANKPSGRMMMAFLAVFVLIAAAAYYLSRSKSERLLMIQKPAENILLPAGIIMKNPDGYTVFKTETAGSISYSFVKYDETRKNNAFFKADFSVIPFIDLGFEKAPGSQNEAAVKSALIAKKISDYRAIQQGFPDNSEGKESYDIDYSGFKPSLDSEIIIKGRAWHRYVLEKSEIEDKDRVQKTWTNIYGIHGIYFIVLDFITVKRPEKSFAKEDENTLAGIESDIKAMIEGIVFN